MNAATISNGIGIKHVADYGVILESQRLLERLLSRGNVLVPISSYHLDYDWFLFMNGAGTPILVAVSQGAPMAVDLAERYVHSGVKKIVRIGTTGALVKSLRMGDVVIPFAAIRDEGTSGFYIDGKAPALTDIGFSMEIAKALRTCVNEVHQGIVWSTDGRWKESDDAVSRYIASGAIAGDMESSALFALGIEKKVSVCSISIVSDEIAIGGEHKGLSDKEIWFEKVLPTFDSVFATLTTDLFR